MHPAPYPYDPNHCLTLYLHLVDSYPLFAFVVYTSPPPLFIDTRVLCISIAIVLDDYEQLQPRPSTLITSLKNSCAHFSSVYSFSRL